MPSWRAIGALAAVACLARGEEGEARKPVWRFQIELLYAMHTSVDTDEKLGRIRALVLKAYPDAKFAEVSAADRKAYYGIYRDRLLRVAGVPAAADKGYEVLKAQVAREVELRSIFEFLHSEAKDDVSLKVIFEKLKEKDGPKNPVCGTEPGKTAIVYRDFGGRPLSGDQLTEIEDSGVRFGFSFKPRVTGLGSDDLPKMSRKADTLGPEGEGRQIFRLVAVTRDPPPAPEAPSDRK